MVFILIFLALARLFVLSPQLARANAIPINTSVIATAPTIILSAQDFEWYENTDAVTPVTTLAAANIATTTPNVGTSVRVRMNLSADLLPLPNGTAFILQYANSIGGTFFDVSTSTAWAFVDNPSVADGQTLP